MSNSAYDMSASAYDINAILQYYFWYIILIYINIINISDKTYINTYFKIIECYYLSYFSSILPVFCDHFVNYFSLIGLPFYSIPIFRYYLLG